MCFIRWHPKTALQGQPEQKPAGALLYFSWVSLRPDPAHGWWTCTYKAAQGTGCGEEGFQTGALLSDTLLVSPVGQASANILLPNYY